MSRRLEIVYVESKHTRLTITDERITLKIAPSAPATTEKLTATAQRIAEQVPLGTASLRGDFSHGGYVMLNTGKHDRASNHWGKFDINGERVTGI